MTFRDGVLTTFHWLDDWRICYRLTRVERRLRRVADSSGVRQQTLDMLHEYRQQREYPRNHEVPRYYSPCFIDPDDRLCAVAYLMIETGAAAPAKIIASTENYARIHDMEFNGLAGWAKQVGLSVDELAQIQPSYPCKEYAVILSFFSVVTLPITLSLLSHDNLMVRGLATVMVFMGVVVLGVGVLSVFTNLQKKHKQTRIKQASSIQELRLFLQDNDFGIFMSAVNRLGDFGADAIPVVVEVLNNGGNCYVVRALLKIDDLQVLSVLENLLWSGRPECYREVMNTLASIRKPETIPILTKALKHHDSLVRRIAADNMRKKKVVSALPDLMPLLEDQDETVQSRAQRAITFLQSEQE